MVENVSPFSPTIVAYPQVRTAPSTRTTVAAGNVTLVNAAQTWAMPARHPRTVVLMGTHVAQQ